jgi:hypothetical protein
VISPNASVAISTTPMCTPLMSPAWVSAFTSGMKMMMVGTGSMKSPTTVNSSTSSSIIMMRIVAGDRGDPVGDHDGAAQIGQHPAERVGGADGDQRQREDQPGQAEVVGQSCAGAAIERGDHHRDDPDHRDHAGLGRREPAGQMPPSRITGIISGSAASRRRTAIWRTARGLRMPERAEEIAIDHQAEADHEARHHAGHEQAGDRDVADRAIDHGGDARRHQAPRWSRRRR